MGCAGSESVPRGISKKAIFQSTSDLSTSCCPAIRNGQCACYVPLGEVVSCLSRLPGGPSDRLVGDSVVLSVMSGGARISSSARLIPTGPRFVSIGVSINYRLDKLTRVFSSRRRATPDVHQPNGSRARCCWPPFRAYDTSRLDVKPGKTHRITLLSRNNCKQHSAPVREIIVIVIIITALRHNSRTYSAHKQAARDPSARALSSSISSPPRPLVRIDRARRDGRQYREQIHCHVFGYLDNWITRRRESERAAPSIRLRRRRRGVQFI